MTNIIKVRFLRDEKPYGREYSYLTPEEVRVEDVVEMATRSGIAKGVVTQINVPESEIASFKDKMKTILGKYKRDEIHKPIQGEIYFLVGSNSRMEYIEENETEYIFMNGMSPWGGEKEKIIQMIKIGQLKLIRSNEEETK